jgi:cell division protein FtsW
MNEWDQSVSEDKANRMRQVLSRIQFGRWDWVLFGVASLLVGLGLLMNLSASSMFADERYLNELHFFLRQGAGVGIGVVTAAIVTQLPYSWLRRSVWPAYFLTLFLYVLVMTPMGHEAYGAVRWIDLGIIKFQPSELGKLTLILALSHYLACNTGRLRDVFGVIVPGISLVIPMFAMMVYQLDFGTTVIFLGLSGVLFFVAGIHPRYGFIIGGIALVGLSILVAVEPYRVKRLTSFIDPFADSTGAGYQVVQGWIALASGGWTGQGLASGVAQRGFLPEAHTDFIAAVLGEELGAVGWLLMSLAYGILVWRGLEVAKRAPDLFGLLVAVGITTLIAAQVTINLGVVGGLLPPKGLVLPFLSYGASAIVIHCICIGILLRISQESQEPRRARA